MAQNDLNGSNESIYTDNDVIDLCNSENLVHAIYEKTKNTISNDENQINYSDITQNKINDDNLTTTNSAHDILSNFSNETASKAIINTSCPLSAPVNRVPVTVVRKIFTPDADSDSCSIFATPTKASNNEIMEFEIPTANKFDKLDDRILSLPDSRPIKKYKSSSDIAEDTRYDEIFSLKLQLESMQNDFVKLQEEYSKNVSVLKSRIGKINDSIALDDYPASSSAFATVISPVKNKRKKPRTRAATVSTSNTSTMPMDVETVPVRSGALASTTAIPSSGSNSQSCIASTDSGNNTARASSSGSGTSGLTQSTCTLNSGKTSVAVPSTSRVSSNFSRAVGTPINSRPASGSQTIQNSRSESSSQLPPFFIYKFTYKDFVHLFPNINFKMQVVNANLKKFSVFNINDYLLIKEKLDDSDSINFFTHTPKSIKPISHIIRGLDSSFTVEEVTSALKAQFPTLNFAKVMQFTTKFSRANNKDLGLWLVQLAPGSSSTEFRKLKLLLNSVISIESMKSGGVVQCHNCQRYDHIAINCGMPFRCVRCDRAHEPGQCISSEPSSLTCVNCGGNHTANYGGCPKRVAKALSSRPTPGTTRNTVPNSNNFPALPAQRRTPQVTRPVTSNFSYANAVMNASSQSAIPNITNSSSPLGFLQTEINSLFGCSLSAIFNKFKAFIPVYSQTVDLVEKKMLLLNFLFEMVNNG